MLIFRVEQGWANFLARGPHSNVEIVCGPHNSDLKKKDLQLEFVSDFFMFYEYSDSCFIYGDGLTKKEARCKISKGGHQKKVSTLNRSRISLFLSQNHAAL